MQKCNTYIHHPDINNKFQPFFIGLLPLKNTFNRFGCAYNNTGTVKKRLAWVMYKYDLQTL